MHFSPPHSSAAAPVSPRGLIASPAQTKGVFQRTLLLLMAGVLFGADLKAQDQSMPSPSKEHAWLQTFVGEWETDIEVSIAPGAPPIKGKGTETGRDLGGFWVVLQGAAEMEGMPEKMLSYLTLGFDPKKQRYIGSWVDSLSSHLWTYQGALEHRREDPNFGKRRPISFQAQ